MARPTSVPLENSTEGEGDMFAYSSDWCASPPRAVIRHAFHAIVLQQDGGTVFMFLSDMEMPPPSS